MQSPRYNHLLYAKLLIRGLINNHLCLQVLKGYGKYQDVSVIITCASVMIYVSAT